MRARSMVIMVIREIIMVRVKFTGDEGDVKCGGDLGSKRCDTDDGDEGGGDGVGGKVEVGGWVRILVLLVVVSVIPNMMVVTRHHNNKSNTTTARINNPMR